MAEEIKDKEIEYSIEDSTYFKLTDKILANMRNQDRSVSSTSLMLGGDPGIGKCLSGDTEIDIQVSDELFDLIVKKRVAGISVGLKRTIANLRRLKYEVDYLNIDYWIANTLSVEEAISECKRCRMFKEFFLEQPKNVSNWKQSKIKERCQEIVHEVLTNKVTCIKDLSGFSDKVIQCEFWTFRGWSMVEATQKVSDYQKSNYDHCRIMFNNNPEIKDSYTETQYKYWVKKGYSVDHAKDIVSNIQRKFSKSILEEKYGLEVAVEKLKERNERWLANLKENNDWDELSKRKDSSSLNYFLHKFNDLEKAQRAYELACKQKDCGSLDYFISKFGDTKKAYDEYNKRIENIHSGKGNTGCRSKESKVFFDNLVESFNLSSFNTIYNSSEYFIIENNKHYYYDFTIPEISLIIEYHGTAFHPNPSWDKVKWNNWKQLFSMKTADEVYLHDQKKKKIAEDHGFIVIEFYADSKLDISKIGILIENALENVKTGENI